MEPPNETAKKKVHHRSFGDVELHGSGLVARSPMLGMPHRVIYFPMATYAVPGHKSLFSF